jgi:hypothetical protein
MVLSAARMTKIAILCLFLLLGFAGPALAQDGGDPIHPPVPEIDPASAMSAITLLAGGMLLFANKFRKKT